MRNARVRFGSLAAKQYAYFAHRFNKKYEKLKMGTKYNFYDGMLFKTRADKFSVVTDVLALPVNVLALNITSRDTNDFINGRAAHVRNVDVARISRDVFYVDGEDTEELSTGAAEGTAADIPEAFAFGDPMPEGTPSLVYNGFTGKQCEGYVTTRSSRAYDQLTTSFPDRTEPFVAPDEKFWVEVVLNTGNEYRRFTFSEPWLRVYAPRHNLISRAHRTRITTHFVAACSNGRRLAISVPMTIDNAFDEITNNYSWGAYNALTLCIDMDGEEGPEVLWHDLWDRRFDGDARTGPYEYWPEFPFDDSDYVNPPLSGYNQNTVVDWLDMDPTGIVFGGRIITAMIKLPNYRTNPDAIDYQQDLLLSPFGGQVVKYVEWTPEGIPSEALAAQNCEAGLLFYNKLQAEGALPVAIKNTVLTFLQAYNVQNTSVNSSGVSAGVLYKTDDVGVGYDGETRYLFVQGLRIYKDGGGTNDLTGGKVTIPGNSTQYAIIRKQEGGFDAAAWFTSDTGFESVGSRNTSGRAGIVGMDSEGLSLFYFHQNIRKPTTAFVGGDTFATPATDAAITDEISMLLAFMSSVEFYTKPLPGAGADNTTIGDESVRTIQEEIPASDAEEDPIPSVLALTDDSGAYISNDGGDNWIRVIVSQRYRDLAYIGNKFLTRPFNKSGPVR